MNFKHFKELKYITEASARIQHAEDIIFWEGSNGVLRVVDALKGLANDNIKATSLKWDGSPAVVFGRNEKGQFVMSDKSGFTAKSYDGKATSPEMLRDVFLNRSGGRNREIPSYVEFANKMAALFPIYEKAVPKNYRGYFKGDLLYFNTPEIIDNHYVFTPNIVTYKVKKDSELGRKIGQSTSGIVIHRQLDEEGNEFPLKSTDIFQGNDILVIRPVFVQEAAKIDYKLIEQIESKIKQNSRIIDSFLDENKLRQLKISDMPSVFYTYLNSKVDTGLDNLGSDFLEWLSNSKVSGSKQANIVAYIKENQQAYKILWQLVTEVMDLKDDIVDQFDSQDMDVKQSIGKSEGGEGYVLADPRGDVKLVPRRKFSAANRSLRREGFTFNSLYNTIIKEGFGKTAVIAYGRLNPLTLGHKKLIDTIINKAQEVNGTPYIFLSHTQKPKTDPLSLKEKIFFADKAFPEINIGNKTYKGEFTPPQALEELYKAGYTDVYFIVGSDRLPAFQFIKNYNNIPDKSGKLLYAFNTLEILSAGERDPDAEGVEGMSASKMRQAVVDNDFKSFLAGSPLPTEKLTKQMFDAVKTGMNLK